MSARVPRQVAPPQLDTATRPTPKFVGFAFGGPLDGKEIALDGVMGTYREEGRIKGHYVFRGSVWEWRPLETHAERQKKADKKRLREKDARIRQLEKSAPVPIVDQAAIDRAVTSAEKRVTAEYSRRIAVLETQIGKSYQLAEKLVQLLNSERTEASVSPAPLIVSQKPSIVSQKLSIVSQKPSILSPKAPAVAQKPAPVSHNGDLKAGQRKILNALAELRELGVSAATRVQLGVFAGYNLTGGTGAQHIADLNSQGYVEVPAQGCVSLTERGLATAESEGTPQTLDELHDRVRRKLPAGQVTMLDHLISLYPDSISRADLGAAVGYNLTGGTGAQHIADLRNAGVVTIPRQGHVRAADLLFPEALT